MVAVLNAMSALVREVRERSKRIDPKVFRAILYYLDVFPEREHHWKEEAVLFPRIRQRTRDADAILDELACEHESGEHAIRDLEQAGLATRVGALTGRHMPHWLTLRVLDRIGNSGAR